jgi:uncharacterized protein
LRTFEGHVSHIKFCAFDVDETANLLDGLEKMEIQGERIIGANRDTVWKALNNPELLKRAITGCQSFEAQSNDVYNTVVAVKIGPVSARFNATVALTNIEPPERYTINFDGKGGVAGFGKGSANVSLEEMDQKTKLVYVAKAQVGGKLAQIGSRLMDVTAGKLTEEFFQAFEQEVMVGVNLMQQEKDGLILAEDAGDKSGDTVAESSIAIRDAASHSRLFGLKDKRAVLYFGIVLAAILAWLWFN